MDHFQKEASEPFPFLHFIEYDNDLAQYFNSSARKPNFVFLIVEGLGRDFTGPDALYGGFTPFLDSVSSKSLYWENFLSNAGRTFGALPSILGALPYGEGGFMNYGTKMPDHHTLITLLKPLGYTSNFFYGGNPNFDNQDIFLEYQGFNSMIDETKFPVSFRKRRENKEVSSWGYPDSELFSYAEEVLHSADSPRVDVYLTLSTHEPFVVPDSSFNQLFEEKLDQLKWDDLKRKTARDNKSVFSCLLYSDNAIRNLMKYYASRKDYENTIFIITGDHRLLPIPASNTIKRFHVPLIIFSPLIKQPASFSSLSVHSDIGLSVLSILKSQYGLQVPTALSTISGPLSTGEEFSSFLDLALIRHKNAISDYIEGDYFLSDDRLFRITPDLDLIPVQDQQVKNRLRQKLQKFKSNGIYACENNQLTKERSTSNRTSLLRTKREQEFIQSRNIDTLTPDEKFQKARSYAFSKNYFECRAVLRTLLTTSPNYHDARILMARTYAWAAAYDSAMFYLKQTIQRAPNYTDAFTAWADIEFWRGDFDTSLEVVHKGLSIDQSNTDLLARKARAFMVLNKEDEARNLVDRILKSEPRQELALSLRAQLTKR
jgi:tetratricopeptide (TPR) repeat protein